MTVRQGIAVTRVVAALALLSIAGAAPATAQGLIVTRDGSREVRPGPATNFTGDVRVDMLFEAVAPAHASGGSVTFEAGARTAWHTHPRGQVLIITVGTGRVQRWGDAIIEVRPGDVVRIPPDQKHWHGAAPESSMTHIAISEPVNGSAVEWMEKVSDEQYGAAPGGQEIVQPQPRMSGPLQQKIAPGLAALTDDVLYGDVWRRQELSLRDRSLVTIAALIATGKTVQLRGHLGRGLDNGIQPSEASAVLAHLAIYAGWPSAVSALEIYDQVYTARTIDPRSLQVTAPRVAPSATGVAQANVVSSELGNVAPKFVQLNNEVVLDDLWRRADLAPRDRSLVTIAALAAMGHDDLLDPYLQRAAESGLTRDQMAEAMTHLGFYAGWARATKALAALARLAAR
jgi:4-carboxymuconolactone decarboxylase